MNAEQQMIISLRQAGQSPMARWVEWQHISKGKSHCPTCLRLDGCWFVAGQTPQIPQHPFCHCDLLSLPYMQVATCATAAADYSKFDPYLFNPDRFYSHNKQVMFESWGYHIEDARWLQSEIERQGLEKYIAGDYTLGVLNTYGQRISIRVEIPRKVGEGTVSFITGWLVWPNGRIQLNTPYGGV